MKLIFTLFYFSFYLFFYSQSINQDQIIGSWEVIRIDNKIFKGGVITYFKFTEDQLLYAMSKNNKDHGVLKNKILIGKYMIKNNMLIIENSNNDKTSNPYKIFFKENKQNKQQLVMEEFEESTQRLLQTSYLIKWEKQ